LRKLGKPSHAEYRPEPERRQYGDKCKKGERQVEMRAAPPECSAVISIQRCSDLPILTESEWRYGAWRRKTAVPCIEIHIRRKSFMARYGKGAQKSVRSAMRRKKHGTLRSGKSGKGGRVKSRKQAIAIGLSEARKKGAKVPKKKSSQ
jgi:hypothetical protein